MQCLKVDDVIPCYLQCTVVLVGVVLKDLLGGTTWWHCERVATEICHKVYFPNFGRK